MKKTKYKILTVFTFTFVFMLLGITNVNAATVTATTFDELKEAVNGHNDGVTDTSITEVKLGADIAIPASSYMGIYVVNDFTLDLNGHTLDITNDGSIMEIQYGSNNIENFTSGSLTITDTSASQTGTIKLGIKSIFVYQQNISNTGMQYKLTIDGGKFYGISGVSNYFFEFNTDNEYYWKDKLITFDFKITKGYFEHVSTNMSSIVWANDAKSNNVTFNMSFDNLTFKSLNNRLIQGNESYSIGDVVPEDTNFYVFNSSGDKQVLISNRTTSVTREVPSSLWYNVDGYTNTNYAGIKLVKKDGFDVTAPTFSNEDYGYSSISAKGISIYNRGTSSLQVKSVTVDEPSKFTITGSTQPTIASKATDNTSFTIKPVDGLNADTYTATITITDMADKTYTTTVTFVVEKNDITPAVDITGWTYGDSANTPSVTGNTGSGTETFEYKLKTAPESAYDTTVPTNAGEYTVRATIGTTTNYNGNTATKDFTISKKIVTVKSDVSMKNKTFDNTDTIPSSLLEDIDLVGITESTSNYTRSAVLNNLSNKYVGTGKLALVTITLSESAYVNYSFVTNSQTYIANFSFNINAATSTITPNSVDYLGNSSTTINLTKGHSIDLKDYLGLDPTAYKNDLTYALVGTPTGVSLSGSELSASSSASTGTVQVKVNFAGKDLNTDATLEYNAATEVSIYIKIVDKETVTIDGLTYTSRDYNNSPIVPTGTLSVSGNKVPVSELEIRYVGTNSGNTYDSANAPTNAGDYEVTYKVADTNANYIGSKTYSFSINKATPSYTLPSNLKGVKGSNLSTVTLAGFTWNTPSTVMNTVGNQTFKATFTPSDTANYKVMNDLDITVYVKDIFTVSTSVNGVNGAISSGSTNVIEGANFEITFTPSTGYKIDKVLVNSVDKTSDVVSNKLTLTNITANANVVVNYKKIEYTITINPVTGATITPNGEVKVEYGTDKEFTITANHGYNLTSVKVDGVEKLTDLISDKLTLTNVTADSEIVVTVEEITYIVTDGADQQHEIKKDEDAIFKINADFSLFETGGKVYVDNIEISSDKYTATMGSTIITLKQSYLDSLSAGSHTLKVEFNDGGNAITNFSIKAAEESNPKTGDNIFGYIMLGLISITGIAGAGIIAKKKKLFN
ncbi:MAG: hypothetical protein Q4G04_06130 [bacterium]|nr:hypothetical protein [bacterium]